MVDEVIKYDAHYSKNTYTWILPDGKVFTAVIDPYVVSKACSVGGGAIEHILKKAMRGTGKGHTMEDLLGEIIECANRGLQIERGE